LVINAEVFKDKLVQYDSRYKKQEATLLAELSSCLICGPRKHCLVKKAGMHIQVVLRCIQHGFGPW
jgi:hypothetical protein